MYRSTINIHLTCIYCSKENFGEVGVLNNEKIIHVLLTLLNQYQTTGNHNYNNEEWYLQNLYTQFQLFSYNVIIKMVYTIYFIVSHLKKKLLSTVLLFV